MNYRVLIKLGFCCLIATPIYANYNNQSFRQSETGLFFNAIINSNTLNISTVTQNHTYSAAGIKINTPGYSIATGCASITNGYCLFSVSDSSPTHIIIYNPTTGSGIVNFSLCLDGNGPLSCQNYTRSGQFSTPGSPVLTSVTGYNSPLIYNGENFVPSLGNIGDNPGIFYSYNDPTCNSSNMTGHFISGDNLTSSTQFDGATDGSPNQPLCVALCNASVSTYTGPTAQCTNAFYDTIP